MKRFLALFLALGCVISATGCTETEQKFMETLKPVQTNSSTFTSTMEMTFDLDSFGSIAQEIEKNKIAPDGEEYEPFSIEDTKKELKGLLDENGKLKVGLVQNGKYDPSKNALDDSISLQCGEFSLELGDIYTRGSDVYYSKDYMINSLTLSGLIVGGNDKDILKQIDESKKDMQDAFGNKKYLKIETDDIGVTGMSGLYTDYALNTRKDKQLDDMMAIFKDFSSHSVTENENGATFEITSDSYSALITRACEYLRARKDGLSKLFGFETSEYDESDFFFDAVIETVNNHAFNNYLETAGLKFNVKETVGKTDDTHYTDVVEGAFYKNEESPIGTLNIKTEYTLSDTLTMADLSDYISINDLEF